MTFMQQTAANVAIGVEHEIGAGPETQIEVDSRRGRAVLKAETALGSPNPSGTSAKPYHQPSNQRQSSTFPHVVIPGTPI